MKITFRLEELLREKRDMERGVIKRIAQKTSLERHQVAAVLSNKAKYVSLETLAGLCRYLIEEHDVDRADLPGALFRIEPEQFTALVADRRYVELCTGTWTEKTRRSRGHGQLLGGAGARKDGQPPGRRWVMASDSLLQSILMHELFARTNERHPELVEQRLVSAYTDDVALDEIAREAQSVHQAFRDRPEDRGLVCVGSVKSNVVIEQVIAHAFGAKPFVSQDDARRLRDRGCPFFLRYRDDDAQPPSCHAGLQLARSKPTPQPGIYYETVGGWECSPSNDREDPALVFYVYHVPQGRLEMVLGGFSGRATHCLALRLPRIVDRLWPPSYDTDDLQVGAFVVRFRFDDSDGSSQEDGDTESLYRPTDTQVVPLDARVLKQKIGRRPPR